MNFGFSPGIRSRGYLVFRGLERKTSVPFKSNTSSFLDFIGCMRCEDDPSVSARYVGDGERGGGGVTERNSLSYSTGALCTLGSREDEDDDSFTT